MPAEGIGVYPYEETAGNEVSSTYEGRHITVREGELIHPWHADDLVNKGDPVIVCLYSAVHNHATYGRAVGVALASATAVTDFIAVDTEGIWMMTVYADDDNGTQDIEAGDALFISDDSTGTDASIAANGTGDAAISKIRNNVLQTPFGYALGRADAGNAGTMAVKVHWDPRSHLLLDNEMLYFGDGVAAAPDVSLEWTGAALEMLPLGDNIDFLIGNGVNSMDVQIFGHSAADYMLWDSAISRLSLVNTALGNDTRIASYHGTFATPALGDGVGMVEIDMTVTGIATACSVASSTWVNVVGTAQAFASNVDVVSPRNDGVYAPASTTITGAPIAYGGRFQAILTDTDFNWLACFSTNVSVVQTSIFQTNSLPNFGYVAGVHAGAVIGSIPLVCDIGGANVYWVRVYAAAA